MAGKSFKVLITLVVVVCGNTKAGHSQDATEKHDTFAAILRAETSGLSKSSIEEIIRIRERLGGGTGLELTGLVENSDPVSRSAKLPGAQKSLLDNAQPPHPALAMTQSERLFFEMLAGSEEIGFELATKHSELTSIHQTDHIAAIRNAARRVEELAADIEELNLFQDADALRMQANKIRQKARNSIRSADSNTPIRRY